MTKGGIAPDGAPAARGPPRQGIETGELVFCAGQPGLDPASGQLAQGAAAQAERALRNIGAVLDAAGCTFADVVKTTVFLVDIGDFRVLNDVYAGFFGDGPPARTLLARRPGPGRSSSPRRPRQPCAMPSVTRWRGRCRTSRAAPAMRSGALARRGTRARPRGWSPAATRRSSPRRRWRRWCSCAAGTVPRSAWPPCAPKRRGGGGGARGRGGVGGEVELAGINARVQLATAEADLRWRILEGHLLAGVTMQDPTTVFIDAVVELGQDVVIEPNVILRGRPRIGAETLIGAGSQISHSVVGERCRIRASVLESCEVEDEVTIGPFAHLRAGASIGRGAELGNYAEVKKSRLGPGTKQHHFSYIGDAEVGAGVNIGAGTITANYDGTRKHRTVIGDGAFIGSRTHA